MRAEEALSRFAGGFIGGSFIGGVYVIACYWQFYLSVIITTGLIAAIAVVCAGDKDS